MWSWAYHRKLWVRRDRSLRLRYQKIELKKIVLKSLTASITTESYLSRCYYNKILAKAIVPRRLSCSFFRTYCHRTGTGRSVFKLFKYSRHEVKRLVNKGLIQGFRKSSF